MKHLVVLSTFTLAFATLVTGCDSGAPEPTPAPDYKPQAANPKPGGDVAGGLLSGFIMLQAARAGAPASVLVRMLGNVLIDVGIGAVPILGDLFDVAWRANSMNVRLLDAWRERPVATRRASRFAVGAILVALFVVIALAVWGSIALFGALFDLLKAS